MAQVTLQGQDASEFTVATFVVNLVGTMVATLVVAVGEPRVHNLV